MGVPGVGKSVLAPRLGYAIAQGQEVFGLRTRSGLVFYLAAEDEAGMRNRVAALKERHGDTDHFVLVGGVHDPISQGNSNRVAVRRLKPAVIFIDTLAMVSPGLKENDLKEWGV